MAEGSRKAPAPFHCCVLIIHNINNNNVIIIVFNSFDIQIQLYLQ
jgi:hypothetical protein